MASVKDFVQFVFRRSPNHLTTHSHGWGNCAVGAYAGLLGEEVGSFSEGGSVVEQMFNSLDGRMLISHLNDTAKYFSEEDKHTYGGIQRHIVKHFPELVGQTA